MAKKSYSEKLKDPRWQKKRLEILNIHGFKCEKCGCEEKELHVHHRFYLKGREVWQYDNDVFQVLCCDCHEKEHSNEKEIIEVIPEKYKELIDDLEKCDKINQFNSDSIKFIVNGYLEFIEDEDFIINLASACNGGYLERLKFDLMSAAEDEKNHFKMWSKINELTKIIEELKHT